MKNSKKIILMMAMASSAIWLWGCQNGAEPLTSKLDAVTEYEVEMIPDVVEAKKNLDGELVLPNFLGRTVTMQDATEAFVSPNREKYAYIEEDGTLYWNAYQSGKEHMTLEDVVKIHNLSDSSIVFEKKDGSIYCGRLEEESCKLIAKTAKEIMCSKNGEIVACITEENKLVLSRSNKQDGKKIYSVDPKASLKHIADDGNVVVYNVEKDGSQDLVILDVEEKKSRISEGFSTGKIHVFASEDGCIWAFAEQDNKLLVKMPGEESKKITFKTIEMEYRLFGDIGSYTSNEHVEGEFVYIYGKSENTWKFLSISETGEVKELLTDVYVYDFSGGTVAYIDYSNDEMACCAKVENGELLATAKIAENVETLKVSDDGKYIYYNTYQSEGTAGFGDLYCYSAESGESVLISENVFVASGKPEYATIYPINEGVIYGKDMEDPMHFNEESTVTLMLWNREENKSELIDRNVLPFSVSSGLKNRKIDSKFFKYAQLEKIDSEGNLIVDWGTYNGERVETIFSDSNLTTGGQCYW